MKKEKIKVYTYTRVSTAMQIDGYSLDAQKAKMKAYADYNDYEIVGEYEDAGKSGKSIEGRAQFSQMMEDIKSGKDGVSYVLVFKLSRFGRNAADVLSSLQVMQDFGVNLVCVEDGIDSSKDAGKLMISVLSAVAEIERENIRVQTMEGRIQKAREGRWNGGFAPYGYQLVDGKLIINEEEAEAIRVIYDQYVHTDIGANGIAKYLENHGIRKIPRQNGKNPLFDAHLIRLILKNPVYCGKIAYGRRKTEKVRGTRNEYKLVEQDNYLLADGQHEAIVSEEVWQAAQVKLLAQAKKYEHVNRGKDEHVHLLSGIVKCPVCGAGMYGNKSIKHKADGTKYKDFYYYGCKHRTMIRGHKCDYKKQIREELLDDAVAEVIVKLVSNPKFAAMMQEKINMKVDTAAIDQEIANYEKQLRQHYSIKSKLAEEIDSLDPDDRHYVRRKADLDDRLYRMYDKIEDTESLLIAARAKKQAIEAEKLTGDNIYKVLIYFEKLYGMMNEVERRQLIEALISEIQIYPERQPNGQWLKSIKFKLPIIEEDMSISLDNEEQVEPRPVTLTVSILVPMSSNIEVTSPVMPCMSETRIITEPTPMMMPSMVRKARILLPARLLKANLNACVNPIRQSPLGNASRAGPSKMILPSATRTTRFASCAMPLSCVIRTMVFPSSFSFCRKSSTSRLVRLSSAPVGSSARMTEGSPASARAMETRCCWPPDSWLGRFLYFPFRPTRSIWYRARSARSSAGMPAYNSASSTFSCTFSLGIRLYCWKMKPSVLLRISACSSSVSSDTSSPFKKYCPLVGTSRQPIMFISVLLPEPDWPTMATNSPLYILSDTPSEACTSVSPMW